jgi:ubiquinone/menaquinone biosynthesis C-methylase UbiE
MHADRTPPAAEKALMHQTQSHYDRDSFNLDIAERIKYYTQETIVFGRLLKKLRGQTVRRIIDVGCGVGTLSKIARKYLSPQSAVALDLSSVSLAQLQQKDICKINGTNLALPLKQHTSDLTISNGVIHHTPNPRTSFNELSRITKPNGLLYVSVYYKGWYFVLFHTLGAFIKLLYKLKLTFLLHAVFMPPYYILFVLGTWLQSGKLALLPWRMVWVVFSDQWITPQATFHTKKEMLQWGTANNLTCIDYGIRNLGSMVDFLFIKKA